MVHWVRVRDVEPIPNQEILMEVLKHIYSVTQNLKYDTAVPECVYF